MASPATKPPKPPKLLLDRTHGPHPDLRSKFKSPGDFKKMYRAYQWLQGHDLRVADETPTSIRLACATHPTCPFNVTALYTVFTEGPVAGKPGFYINPPDFHPRHDHSPPYIPMNHQVENARRAKLQHDDPSLENPPLVLVQGFAGSDSEEPASASEAGPPPAPSGAAGAAAPAAYGFASAADDHSRATPSARGGSHQPPPTTMPQANHSTAATTTMYPHDTVMRASASPAVGSAAPLAPQPPPPPAAAAVASASSSSGYPHPTTTTMRRPTELQTFLLEIHPRFADYFPYFRHLLPLDTSIEDLLSLDEGLAASPEDHTVFNLFREIKELPLLLVAMAADGVRKAKIRRAAQNQNPAERGHEEMGWNPRIAEGLEKAKAEKWVRDRIREGQAVLARGEAAAV